MKNLVIFCGLALASLNVFSMGSKNLRVYTVLNPFYQIVQDTSKHTINIDGMEHECTVKLPTEKGDYELNWHNEPAYICSYIMDTFGKNCNIYYMHRVVDENSNCKPERLEGQLQNIYTVFKPDYQIVQDPARYSITVDSVEYKEKVIMAEKNHYYELDYDTDPVTVLQYLFEIFGENCDLFYTHDTPDDADLFYSSLTQDQNTISQDS